MVCGRGKSGGNATGAYFYREGGKNGDEPENDKIGLKQADGYGRILLSLGKGSRGIQSIRTYLKFGEPERKDKIREAKGSVYSADRGSGTYEKKITLKYGIRKLGEGRKGKDITFVARGRIPGGGGIRAKKLTTSWGLGGRGAEWGPTEHSLGEFFPGKCNENSVKNAEPRVKGWDSCASDTHPRKGRKIEKKHTVAEKKGGGEVKRSPS